MMRSIPFYIFLVTAWVITSCRSETAEKKTDLALNSKCHSRSVEIINFDQSANLLIFTQIDGDTVNSGYFVRKASGDVLKVPVPLEVDTYGTVISQGTVFWITMDSKIKEPILHSFNISSNSSNSLALQELANLIKTKTPNHQSTAGRPLAVTSDGQVLIFTLKPEDDMEFLNFGFEMKDTQKSLAAGQLFLLTEKSAEKYSEASDLKTRGIRTLRYPGTFLKASSSAEPVYIPQMTSFLLQNAQILVNGLTTPGGQDIFRYEGNALKSKESLWPAEDPSFAVNVDNHVFIAYALNEQQSTVVSSHRLNEPALLHCGHGIISPNGKVFACTGGDSGAGLTEKKTSLYVTTTFTGVEEPHLELVPLPENVLPECP